MNSKEECKKKKPGKRGLGTIRQRANGNYEYRFPYVDEFYQRRYRSFTRPTIDECVEAAELFKQQIEAKGRMLNENATVSDILMQKVKTDYLKNYTGEQGYGRNLETIKIFERNGIGNMKIIDVKPYHIDRFLTSITQYSDKTISKIYGMLKSAFELAFTEKVIEVNYMTRYNARRPRSSKKPKVVRGFTEDEQLLTAIKADEPEIDLIENGEVDNVEQIPVSFLGLEDEDGGVMAAVFTSMDELGEVDGDDIEAIPVKMIFQFIKSMGRLDGIIIDPFSDRFVITKEKIAEILDDIAKDQNDLI